jgi:hypothetical protein
MDYGTMSQTVPQVAIAVPLVGAIEGAHLNANTLFYVRVLGVSRRTLFRGLRAARDHDELAAAH